MIFDALQSTTAIKALPIIDDIGSTVGVIVKKFGGGIPNFGLGVKARSVATCNEQEGRVQDLNLSLLLMVVEYQET